jgi:transposase
MPPELQHLSKEEIAQKFLEAKFEIEQLTQKLEWFRRQMFGTKSERFIPSDENQLKLFEEQASALEKEQTATQNISYERSVKSDRKEKPVRTDLPAHLRREEKRVEPDFDITGKIKIGEEVSEYLQETPGEVYVLRVIRDVYAEKNNPDGGINTVELPQEVLPKFNIGCGMLALMMVRKYVDHQPLYRQIEAYRRNGLVLSDSTVGGWIRAGANLLIPLYDYVVRKIFSATYLMADETGIRVLDRNKKGKSHKGWYWVYHDPLLGLILFEYQPGRDASGPQARLKNYAGYLQTDGYKVYDGFESRKDIILLCCAHARRYFEQALKNDKTRAEYALSQIRLLYAIERSCDEAQVTADERQKIRAANAAPILAELKKWMIINMTEVAPKSAIGKAIQYSLARWDKLEVYLTDGNLRIDNNLTENSIRPIALGRKNYLFAGSHESAQRAAVIYTFMSMCKRHEVNPYEWLSDILGRINQHPINRLEDLLPKRWKELREETSTIQD